VARCTNSEPKEDIVPREFLGDLPTSRETEWLEFDESRNHRLPTNITRLVVIIGGIPFLVLLVLAVWNLPAAAPDTWGSR
jgi:hypothetical protein